MSIVQAAECRKPETQTKYHYVVTAAAEPSVMQRVAELFTLRDLIPDRFECRHIDDDEPTLHLEVAVSGLERQHAEHLAMRLRNIMPVTGVLLDWD